MSNAGSKLWYFENVDLFSILCPTKTPSMAEKHPMTKFNKDDYIYFPDDPSQHVFMIASGRVKIGGHTSDGKEMLRAILGEGEVFGELALTGEEKRKDFAQAMDNNTNICPMTIGDLEELMVENKTLSLKLYKLIGIRFRKLERKLESLVFKDARTRIIEFLKDMAEERGQKVGFEMMIKNHLTHKDIASLTGTSRQTVTTILNELKEKNIINFDRRRILIRDMEALK